MTRIVAGRARGVRLRVPAAGTRPTSDRAREAVFSSLESLRGPWEGARVLDLYAGSGACGLEAASRGARHVDLVESSRPAARVIEHNRDAVATSAPGPTVVVHALTVQRWVERLDGQPVDPYDVVFCDPPYTTSSLEVRHVLDSLTTSGLLAAAALVVLERSARDTGWTFDEPLRAVWDRRYGEAHLWVAGVSA